MENPDMREPIESAARRYAALAEKFIALGAAYSIRRATALNGRANRGGGRIHAMPLDLSALELETAARACRAMVYQEVSARSTWKIQGCASRSRVLHSGMQR
jgi:hypothetical protein